MHTLDFVRTLSCIALAAIASCSNQTTADMSGPQRDAALPSPPDSAPPTDMACTPDQGAGCCYPTCPPGQMLSCLGANICGYPCSCVPIKDGGSGTDGGALLWYTTCGDPVCSSHHPSGLLACTTQKPGQQCTSAGQQCDPNNPCNSYLICATSDPKHAGYPK